jgi:hypothetical protein
MIIQCIGDSLARGLGIMAAMAIIRFKTNFKGPRDTLFLFASLAADISCGAYAFAVAVTGTLGFCLVSLALYISPLGPDRYFDIMLVARLDDGIDYMRGDRMSQHFACG